MITYKQINISDPLYQLERELRNEVLLRPKGQPDNSFEMNDQVSYHFVAVQDGAVVACLLLFPDGKDKNSGRLMQMAVAGSMQGQGLGSELVKYMIEFAKTNNFKEITVHARGTAVPFYEKLGFVSSGEPFDEIGFPHMFMKKRIA